MEGGFFISPDPPDDVTYMPAGRNTAVTGPGYARAMENRLTENGWAGRCPCLAEKTSRGCSASLSGLKPGAEMREDFCESEEHYRCALLVSHVLRGGFARAAG